VLSSDPGIQGLPMSITPDENGVAEAWFQADAEGEIRIAASVEGVGGGVSNPMIVAHSDRVKTRVFWGDVHSHSWMSHDGVGIDPYGYARDAASLDFFTSTEHHNSMAPDEWRKVLDWNEKYLEPGRFVTLVAAEHGGASPSGHFNLYFRQERPRFVRVDKLSQLPDAYGAEAPLVVNHHPGIIWNLGLSKTWNTLLGWLDTVFGPSVDWDEFPEIKRHAVEIYSLHGQSEYFNPQDPLSYENVDLVLPKKSDPHMGESQTGESKEGPHYARDGWAAGHTMGTVAGSDDHQAQPGKHGGGLTAVLVDELTRESVFNAIENRRTYATTGERIFLDFRIDDHQMGSVLPMSEDLTIRISAVGTDHIRSLELMRYDAVSGSWEAIITKEPGTIEFELEETMPNEGPAIFYLRLEQVNVVNERPVRAWSSPIWVGMGGE
jgi:hypothetical protein